MKIQVRTRDVEISDVLRAHAERRLGFALGRFGERIGPVVVRFFKVVDGGRGCRIQVSLRPRRVEVEDEDADLFAAVDQAANRLARSVARALERERALDEKSKV